MKNEVAIPTNNDTIIGVDHCHVTMVKIVSDKYDKVDTTYPYFVLDTDETKKLKYTKKTEITLSSEGDILKASTDTGVINFPMGELREQGEVVIPRLPVLNLDYSVNLPFDELDEIIDNIGSIQDWVEFVGTPDKFTVNVYNTDTRPKSLIFTKEIKARADLFNTDWEGKFVARYPLAYIRMILGSNINKDNIQFKMTSDYP